MKSTTIQCKMDRDLEHALFNFRDKLIEEYIPSSGTLYQIAKFYPKTLQELASIPGIKPSIVKKYGEDLINTVQTHLKGNNITPEDFSVLVARDKPVIEYDSELYNIIFQEMLQFHSSLKKSLTPARLLSPKIITDICKTYPTTKEQLLKIDNFGLSRLNVYGDLLLNIVKNYIDTNPDTVRENLKYFEPSFSNDKLAIINKEININLLPILDSCPKFCNRINIFKISILRLNELLDNNDYLRLIAGGEIKTLIRNVFEPFLNLCLHRDTTNILVVSQVLNTPNYRMELISKYGILPEEINSLNLLYNYTNGCDHIFDGYTAKEKEKNLRYINNFEKINSDEKYTLCQNVLNFINKLLVNTNVSERMEKLIKDIYN